MPRIPSELDAMTTPLLRGRIRTLLHHLPRALGGDEEGIHQLRVASRRLRVGLPLLARRPEGGRVQRALRTVRKIVRTAGPSRDLDVTVALFEKHLRKSSRDSRDAIVLRRRLRAARQRRRRQMKEELLDLDLARLRRDLKVILERGGEALFAVASHLRRFRDAGGAEVSAMLAEFGHRFDPVRLHRFRSRVRHLRYAAEISTELRDAPSEAPRRLKKIQEQLGELHDAFVLSEWLDGQAQAADRRGDSTRARLARELRIEFIRMSREHHREFLEGDPEGTIRRALAEMLRADTAA